MSRTSTSHPSMRVIELLSNELSINKLFQM